MNDRVLLYFAPLGADGVADRQIGQLDALAGKNHDCGGGMVCSPTFRGVAADAAGNVYATQGNTISVYLSPLTTDMVADATWGQGGPPNHNLNSPVGIAVDAAGNVWVADALNSRVVEYDSPLTTDFVPDRSFGKNLSDPPGLSCLSLCVPFDVYVDESGNLFVADDQEDGVVEFASALTTDNVHDMVFGVDSCGACNTLSVTGDTAGNIYVGRANPAEVLKFAPPFANPPVGVSFLAGGCCNRPSDVLITPAGDFYVADDGLDRLLRFASTGGAILQAFGATPSLCFATAVMTERTLCNPTQLAVDGAGRLYAAVGSDDRIMIYDVQSDPDGDGFQSVTPSIHQSPANTSPLVDNCPTIANVDQLNSSGNYLDNSPPYASAIDDKTWPNSDAAGDACDADADNDGITNADELNAGVGCAFITNPLLRDTDADRYLDGAECTLGTNPASAPSAPTAASCAASLGVTLATDTDGDKIRDYIEVCHYGTDRLTTDTDGDRTTDGAKDGCEVASLNGDRIVNSLDQGMVGSGIAGVVPYTANADVNKDGALNSIDQGTIGSFILPAAQCP